MFRGIYSMQDTLPLFTDIARTTTNLYPIYDHRRPNHRHFCCHLVWRSGSSVSAVSGAVHLTPSASDAGPNERSFATCVEPLSVQAFRATTPRYCAGGRPGRRVGDGLFQAGAYAPGAAHSVAPGRDAAPRCEGVQCPLLGRLPYLSLLEVPRGSS